MIALDELSVETEVYAPFGFTDLFRMTTRPNPALAPGEVYEAKTRRWAREWPALIVLPWPESAPSRRADGGRRSR